MAFAAFSLLFMPTKIPHCKAFVVDAAKECGPSVIVYAHDPRQAVFLAAQDPEFHSWDPTEFVVSRLRTEDLHVDCGPRVLDHSAERDAEIYRRNGWELEPAS